MAKVNFELNAQWAIMTWKSEAHEIFGKPKREPSMAKVIDDIEDETWYQQPLYGYDSGYPYLTPRNQKKDSGGSSYSYGKRCYHSHKPLELGDGLKVYGGSCNHPAVEDADVYIGFDHGMKLGPKSYPWNDGNEVKFLVTDGNAPSNPAEFKQLVKWAIEQIRDGKKVHAGCIGGHGRTGTFLAAVVAEMLGIKDAIGYVREHYCTKAVESESQVTFLHKHFGVTKAKPSRTWGATTGRTSHSTGSSTEVPRGKPKDKADFGSAPKQTKSVTSVRIGTSVWGDLAVK